MPPKRSNGKGNGVSVRPRDQPSLIVAFAKQISRKRCTVCSAEIPAGIFAAHRRECKVKSDDEDCQVLFSQTAEEKWAAGLITLDEMEEGRENSMRVKKEGETPTTSRGRQSSLSTRGRRATKRKMEERDSAEDDSDFVMASQKSPEEEETERKRDEPVRTRRSARVNLSANKRRSLDDDEIAAMDDVGENLDMTMFDEEEVAPPPSRRHTRSTGGGESNMILTELDGPPTPDSQGSSMEVETGFVPDIKEGSEDREVEEEAVDLDATLAPEGIEERVTTRRRRGRKDTVENREEPVQEKRMTRRGAKEASQNSQSSQEQQVPKKGRKGREEERKKREGEAKKKEEEKEKERKKKEEEETKRKEEEKAKEQPIAGLTRIVLRALEDKCVRHERGLVPSQELVQAAVITLDEEDPEVVPHYVYLMCKIMRRVLSTRSSTGRVHDESFWGEDLRMVSRFLSLNDDAKLLFIRLFTRKRGWHLPEKLREKYPYLKRMDETLVELQKEGFLENGKTALTSTEETLRLCSTEKLKLIAKDFRVDANKPKSGLIEALLKSAISQRQLFMAGTPGNTGRLLMMSKKHLGPVYRTSSSVNSFFRALFSLYSPVLTDSHLITEDRTINIISNFMFRMKEIHYDQIMRKAPFPCGELIGVYEDKEDLYGFVAAKDSEERMIRALDRHDVNGALVEAERAREKLTEMNTPRMDYLRTVPVHHQQYTTEAILTRIVSRGVDCLERKKDHAAACNWIKFIIKSQVLSSLLPHSIGALYERLALNLHYHCGESDEAIDEIKRALDDPLVPEKNRLNLDDRAKRILKEAWESRFALTPPTEITIEGETIGRDLGNERKNQFTWFRWEWNRLPSTTSSPREWRRGEIWHLAFKLLFWDVIWCHQVGGGVWLCELQIHPVDYDYSLYEARKEAFEARFEVLRKSSLSDRLALIDEHWACSDTMMNRISITEMKSFLTACALPTLLGVMQILVKEPRHRRSGFPDLVLWSAGKQVVMVAEVKGPGDTLSTKQRLWLDFFMKEDGERVKAYLCKPLGGSDCSEME
eukprot:PDM81211.1 fan-1 [Pristionchus pacificus]